MVEWNSSFVGGPCFLFLKATLEQKMGHFLLLTRLGSQTKKFPKKPAAAVLADDVCLSLGASGDGAKSYCSR